MCVTNKNIIQLTLVFLIGIQFGSSISAQSDSLTIWIDKVEQILFAEEDYNCYLYEFMECEEIHKPVYDSFQVVNCYQPDAHEVNSILEKILWTKDPSEYDRLLEIYMRYMQLFLVQFEQVIRDNYYNCKFILNRWSIASNFEMLMISMEFKKKEWDNLKIYKYFKYEVIKKMSKFQSPGQFNAIIDTFQYRFILEEFKTLHPYAPELRHYHTFHYIDPYKTDIHPFIKEDLFKSSLCRPDTPSDSMLIRFLYKNIDILTISDSEVLNYLNDNFACLTKNGNVNRILFSYAINTENKLLLEKVIKHKVRKVWQDDIQFVLTRAFDRILSVDGSLTILMDEIIEIGEQDLQFAKDRLSYIPLQYREEAKSYIKHNAPKESKLYQSLVREDEKMED
jgi:hypothetical protein